MPNLKINKRLAIFALLLGLVVLVLISRSSKEKKTPEEAKISGPEINVTADKGKFTPSEFQMKHFDTITLNVTAKDRAYVFKHEEWGIDASIPKVSTTQVEVTALGVGTFTYNCGEGCSGTINVAGKSDEED